jgi:phosphatidylinositol glycan class W
MDVGVGSFVFSLGIVSTRGYSTLRADSLSVSMATSLRIDGKGRRISRETFSRSYPGDMAYRRSQEHVTEYGVHWNFFFTLGLLPIFGNLLYPLRQHYVRWNIIAILVTLCEYR